MQFVPQPPALQAPRWGTERSFSQEVSRQPSPIGVQLREPQSCRISALLTGQVCPTEQAPRQLAHFQPKVTWVSDGGPRRLRETPRRGQVCQALRRQSEAHLPVLAW